MESSMSRNALCLIDLCTYVHKSTNVHVFCLFGFLALLLSNAIKSYQTFAYRHRLDD